MFTKLSRNKLRHVVISIIDIDNNMEHWVLEEPKYIEFEKEFIDSQLIKEVIFPGDVTVTIKGRKFSTGWKSEGRKH